MNTMVGLQASLHTSVDGGIDLAKNLTDNIDNDDSAGNGFGDIFDADELFNSPMFNDPVSKPQEDALDDSFGSFAIDETEEESIFEPTKSPANAFSSRPSFRVSPKRTVSGPASYSSPYNSPTKNRPQPPFSMMPSAAPPRSPPKMMQTSPRKAPVRQSPTRAVSYNETGMQGMSQDVRLEQMQHQLSQMSTSGTGTGLSQSMHVPFSQSPRRSSGIPAVVSLGNDAPSFGHFSMHGQPAQTMSPSSMNQSMAQTMPAVVPQDVMSTSMQRQSVQTMNQSMAQNMSGAVPQDAMSTSMQRQSVQTMNQSMAQNMSGAVPQDAMSTSMQGQSVQTMNQSMAQNMNWQLMQGQTMVSNRQMLNAQSMNGQPMNMQAMNTQQLPKQQMNQQMNQPMNQQMNQQMNGQPMMQGISAPAFSGFQQGNVSIATGMQTPAMGQQQNPAMVQGQKTPATINNAMEKLCESMKRSAMTRGLVKQISSRSVSRSNSGLNMMLRQGSSRSLMLKQGSDRSLVGDGSGRGPAPIRRMSSTKHILQHHGRGVYRHNSQQSLNSQSAHGVNLHIDGRDVGIF